MEAQPIVAAGGSGRQEVDRHVFPGRLPQAAVVLVPAQEIRAPTTAAVGAEIDLEEVRSEVVLVVHSEAEADCTEPADVKGRGPQLGVEVGRPEFVARRAGEIAAAVGVVSRLPAAGEVRPHGGRRRGVVDHGPACGSKRALEILVDQRGRTAIARCGTAGVGQQAEVLDLVASHDRHRPTVGGISPHQSRHPQCVVAVKDRGRVVAGGRVGEDGLIASRVDMIDVDAGVEGPAGAAPVGHRPLEGVRGRRKQVEVLGRDHPIHDRHTGCRPRGVTVRGRGHRVAADRQRPRVATRDVRGRREAVGIDERAGDRIGRVGVSNRSIQQSGRSDTGGKDPGADAGVPDEAAARRHVLVGAPEGAVVHRINAQGGVVAPTPAAGLHARAGHANGLGTHGTGWVHPHLVTREAHRRKNADAVRGAVDQTDVAEAVHGGRRHPAMDAVAEIIGSLLLQDPTGAGRISQLRPAHASGVRAVDIDRVAGDDRLVTAEVSVLGAVHRHLTENIQPLGGARLRHTVPESAQVAVEGRRRDEAVVGERRVRRRHPVDAEIPVMISVRTSVRAVAVPGGVVTGHDIGVRRAGGRWRALQVRRLRVEDPDGAVGEEEVNELRRVAGQHRGALENHHPGADEAGRKLVVRAVVPVGPHAPLRVVVERARRDNEVIQPIGPQGIGGLGDRHARVTIRVGRVSELGHEPAVREVVVEHDGIAIIVRLADATEPSPEDVARKPVWRGEGIQVAGLVPDLESEVVPLHVVVGTDVAIGVGGHHAETEQRLVVVGAVALEAQDRGRLRQTRHHLAQRVGAAVDVGNPAQGLGDPDRNLSPGRERGCLHLHPHQLTQRWAGTKAGGGPGMRASGILRPQRGHSEQSHGHDSHQPSGPHMTPPALDRALYHRTRPSTDSARSQAKDSERQWRRTPEGSAAKPLDYRRGDRGNPDHLAFGQFSSSGTSQLWRYQTVLRACSVACANQLAPPQRSSSESSQVTSTSSNPPWQTIRFTPSRSTRAYG